MLIGIVPVLFDYAYPDKMVDYLLSLFNAHFVALSELSRCIADTALFEAQHELYFFLCKQPVEYPEIHVVFLHSSRKLARDVVSDHDSELFYELFLFRVIALVLNDRIVSLVDVDPRVDFLYHFSLLVVKIYITCCRLSQS